MSEQAEYLPSARRPRPGRPRKIHPTPEEAIVPPVVARLFNLGASAAYLSVSPWTVRDLEAAGILRRVRIPLPSGGELRKLLFDREDLDRLVQAWKDQQP